MEITLSSAATTEDVHAPAERFADFMFWSLMAKFSFHFVVETPTTSNNIFMDLTRQKINGAINFLITKPEKSKPAEEFEKSLLDEISTTVVGTLKRESSRTKTLVSFPLFNKNDFSGFTQNCKQHSNEKTDWCENAQIENMNAFRSLLLFLAKTLIANQNSMSVRIERPWPRTTPISEQPQMLKFLGVRSHINNKLAMKMSFDTSSSSAEMAKRIQQRQDDVIAILSDRARQAWFDTPALERTLVPPAATTKVNEIPIKRFIALVRLELLELDIADVWNRLSGSNSPQQDGKFVNQSYAILEPLVKKNIEKFLLLPSILRYELPLRREIKRYFGLPEENLALQPMPSTAPWDISNAPELVLVENYEASPPLFDEYNTKTEMETPASPMEMTTDSDRLKQMELEGEKMAYKSFADYMFWSLMARFRLHFFINFKTDNRGFPKSDAKIELYYDNHNPTTGDVIILQVKESKILKFAPLWQMHEAVMDKLSRKWSNIKKETESKFELITRYTIPLSAKRCVPPPPDKKTSDLLFYESVPPPPDKKNAQKVRWCKSAKIENVLVLSSILEDVATLFVSNANTVSFNIDIPNNDVPISERSSTIAFLMGLKRNKPLPPGRHPYLKIQTTTEKETESEVENSQKRVIQLLNEDYQLMTHYKDQFFSLMRGDGFAEKSTTTVRERSYLTAKRVQWDNFTESEKLSMWEKFLSGKEIKTIDNQLTAQLKKLQSAAMLRLSITDGYPKVEGIDAMHFSALIRLELLELDIADVWNRLHVNGKTQESGSFIREEEGISSVKPLLGKDAKLHHLRFILRETSPLRTKVKKYFNSIPHDWPLNQEGFSVPMENLALQPMPVSDTWDLADSPGLLLAKNYADYVEETSEKDY